MNILGLSLALLLQAQLPTVSGTILKPGGSEPLGGAIMSLLPLGTGQVNPTGPTAISEDDGRFTIRNVKPGDYRLSAQTVRYGTSLYGQRKPNGPSTVLSISGNSISDLRFSMIPTGTIAGRITGPNGEPIAYAMVQAAKYVYENGTKNLSPVQTTTTDDRGDYRLYWLPAGQYVVSALARNMAVVSPQSLATPSRPGESNRAAVSLAISTNLEGTMAKRILDDGTVQDESWVPAFYPGTIDPARATLVDTSPGSTTTGINITVGPSRVQSVRGRVVGGGQGLISVTLIPQSAGALRGATGKGASTADGSFAFTGVVPGMYYITALDRAGSQSAPVPVQVGDRDVINLTIAMTTSIELRGKFTLDGAALPTPGQASSVAGRLNGFSLVPDISGLAGQGAGSAGIVTPDGTFRIAGVSPGDYQLRMSGAFLDSKSAYIKSIRLGQTDVTNGIHIAQGIQDQLEVIMTTESGSIRGAVATTRGAAAAGATVVLVPSARKRFDLYKIVVPGSDGKFKFENIPTGDYKLFAWDDVENNAWQDPEFLRNFESRGVAVRLANQTTEDVQIALISAQ